METDNRGVKAWGGGWGVGWRASMGRRGDICNTKNKEIDGNYMTRFKSLSLSYSETQNELMKHKHKRQRDTETAPFLARTWKKGDRLC